MQSSYPSLSCIPGCIGYMNFCLGEYDVCDIDQNGGLPPASWIDAVKKSVMDVYESIKGMLNIYKVSFDNEGPAWGLSG